MKKPIASRLHGRAGARRVMAAAMAAAMAAGAAMPGVADVVTAVAPAATVAATAPPVDQVILACMKAEVPRALQKLGIDPKIQSRDDAGALAHGICRRVAMQCAEAPASDGCQKALLGYGLAAGDYQPSADALLFDAAFLGSAQRVERLLAEGADVNWRNLGGWTPVMIAAAERRVEIVGVLLMARADPNLRNAYGRTALMFASAYGDLPTVTALLAGGAEVNLVPTDQSGWTALVAAASAGHQPVVQALLQAGADPRLLTRDGRRAADLAAANGHRGLAGLLRAAEKAD